MLSKRLFSGLRFRITLAVTLALVVILGAATVWRYWSHSQLEMEEARHQAAITSGLIRAGAYQALLTNNRAELESIVQNVGRQPGVRGLYLLDANGALQLASANSPPDDGPVQAQASLRVPPDGAALTRSQTRVYVDRNGNQVLRYTDVIANAPPCYSCHAATQAALGALVADYALTETDYQLSRDWQGSLVSGLVSLLAVVLATNLVLGRFVLDKLEQFVPALQRIGQGDLSQRLNPRGEDEIGQLAARFNQMADGLQTRARENTQLYTELERKEAARAFLLGKVIVAQEEEHKHLARELHDDFAQSLAALSVTVQSAVQIIPADMVPVHERLARVQGLTQQTLRETSRWIQDLRPRLLDDLGLVPALRAYVEARFEATPTRVQIEINNLPPRLPAEVEITLFRVLQEALSNTAKHAHALNVLVRLEGYEDGTLVAQVQDDGIGFIPARYWQAQEGLRGVGLLGMRERVALLGGTLTLDSTPGRGTRLRVEVPGKERPR